MGIFDVPAGVLIGEIAKELKGRVEKPAWTDWVKTGMSRERSPQNPDWFFVRMASVLYRVYADGPLGTESLKTYYGGRRRRGLKTEHFRKASGKIIRTCLQNLEKEGLIKKVEKGKGRTITGKGEKYLVAKAKEVAEILKHAKGKEYADKGAKAHDKSAEEKGAKAELRKAAEKERKAAGQEKEHAKQEVKVPKQKEV